MDDPELHAMCDAPMHASTAGQPSTHDAIAMPSQPSYACGDGDDVWLQRLRAPGETGKLMMQIIDVQVVDSLPTSISPDNLKGEGFLRHVLEHADDDEYRGPAKACTVLLFGCTRAGSSALVRVTNFRPALYFDLPANVEVFKIELAKQVRVSASQLATRIVRRRNMYGWVPNSSDHPTERKEHPYLEVRFPTVAALRRASRLDPKLIKEKCHEDRITCDTKFLDETSLVPSGWVEIGGISLEADRISTCRYEIECLVGNLTPHDVPDIAPLMTANLDIECVSASGGFPDAGCAEDEIVCIGVVYWRVGTPKETAVKVVYYNTRNGCADIEGAHVMAYPNEREMLRGFRGSCFIDVDPDVIVTYNGFGFDLPYLWMRAKMLNVDDFVYAGRLATKVCKAESKELSSSALGQNDLFIIEMYGRCNLDVFHWVKAREKLESYKLDDVSEHFLGEKKIDMDYKELFRMAYGTPEEQAQVGLYCVQDCYLLVLLAIRLQIFAANVEMSRVCHTPMEFLVTRGQQIKVINQLVWYGHRMDRRENGDGAYIMNTPARFSGGADDSYMGATVIDAKAKFYKDPIATLDFMSLYPSIILANNFCFSTLVMDEAYADIPGVDYVRIDVDENKSYLWAKNFPGVIPVMMDNLLSARKQAKRSMNDAAQRVEECKTALKQVDELTPEGEAELRAMLEKATIDKAVYNARQLALKVSANSIYGFTGAVKTGKYHCLAVADSVTFRAREMLLQTVHWVHEFTSDQCEVVYGDTDSVMVRFFGCTTVEEAAEVAERAATYITDKFGTQTGTRHIVLEFEKVYFPYLLMRKKRYAGLMFEPNKEGVMIQTKLDAKGIELVRRDNCALAKRVQKKTLDALMYKRDPDLACSEIASEMCAIVEDKVELDDYKMSKSRRKTYKNEDLPHLKVVEKMRRRNPGSEPQVGDRVPYVLLVVKNQPKAKTCDKAEDIQYVRDHPDECKIDRLYYVEHQIENSVCALMEHVIDNAQKLFDACKAHLTRQQTNQRSIFDMLTKRSSSDDASTSSTPTPSSSGGSVDMIDAMMSIRAAPSASRNTKRPKRK